MGVVVIEVESKGSFKTEDSLKKILKVNIATKLDKYGKEGRDALAEATPVRSGLTAESWTYEVVKRKRGYSIIWRNTHVIDGIPVAIIIQYGHATGTGGYVAGEDYINPVIKPLFDKIAHDIWNEVKRQ